uniref:MAU2 chromatid cohesion factor homolog n=2 Tax=Lygus hesperus TaxID=30085 RepID=A0A146M8F4_LYGHE
MMASQESCYIALLGLAEHFRSSSPPDILKCIQCLQAVLTIKLPPKVEARTHFQIGSVLHTYTKNLDLAIQHLEQAWNISCKSKIDDDFVFKAASTLADHYLSQGWKHLSISILKSSVEVSQNSVFWHCRLLFQLAQIYMSEGMYEPSNKLLGIGVDYARMTSTKYNEVLFLTSRCLVLFIDKNFPDGIDVLEQIHSVLDDWEGDISQKTYLEGFFLVLKVCHHLALGRVKTAEPFLKRLQKNILEVMCLSPDTMDRALKTGTAFSWMPKNHLRVLVYAVTVMHHMQGGCVNKALKYAEKTLVEISKQKTAKRSHFLDVLEVMCIEHMVMCEIVAGRNCRALNLISQVRLLCTNHSTLLELHSPQLHTLLGLYAMAVDCFADAELQFKTAMDLSVNEELKTFLNLNLAVLYITENRKSGMNDLLMNINPANFPSCSQSMKTAAYLIFGLLELLEGRYNDATKFFKEVVKMANAEYTRRLTSCSLVLLGHVYLTQDMRQECLGILTAAMELICTTGDVLVRLRALSVFKELYKISLDAQSEAKSSETHSSLSEALVLDRSQALKMPEHSLVYWTSGDVPPYSSCD